MKELRRPELTSTVIVNYNTCDILEDCLLNLRKSYAPLQIIVVDNDSTDGSAKMVSEKFQEVDLVALDKNVGLAGGNNVGLDKAKGKYLLFMGSDAFPHDGAINTLVEFMDNNEDVGACVGQVRLRSGILDKDTHRGFPTPWVAFTHLSGIEKIFPRSRLFGKYYLEYKNLSTVHEIDLCTSHFMFTRKNIFKEVGKWDEDFFVFGEDVDLCWRIKKAGWKIMYVPDAHVTHYKGASVGIRQETKDITTATKETQRKMLAETTEAMSKFYRKHYGETGYDWLVIMGIVFLSKLRSIKYDLLNNNS